MSNKLIVHIGMPKTGTSAIQGFLFENREKLADYNLCYPDLIKDMNGKGYRIMCRPEGRTKNGVALCHFRDWEKLDTINSLAEKEWNMFSDILSNYLADSSVIISDEDLWCQGNNYAILRELKKISDNMEVIVYLRRQDLEIEAIWNQVVKRYGYCTLDFQHARGRWEHDRLVKYYETLQNIEAIVGLSEMKVRVYEKGQMRGLYGDIVEDFMYHLGITDLSEFKRIKSVNDRLSGSCLEIKKEINKSILNEKWLREIMEERFLTALSLDCEVKKEAYYSLDERMEIIDKFSKENEDIAKRYLNREDGVLFKDKVVDLPIHKEEIDSKYIIRIFSSMMMQQEQELINLKKLLSYNAINETVNANKKNRKIVLFGAGYVCTKFLSTCNIEISFIVDNKRKLGGSNIQGVPVIHVSEVQNWENYYVIITCGAHADIEQQLKSMGLKKDTDYVVYD